MPPGRFRFEHFNLDPADRQLRRGDEPVELNARYLDALCLLVGDAGKLVSKERFHQEVWRGVPVTDEALTQCIKTLRRQLGDDAARPRFIETVPKHGYRFIAPVETVGVERAAEAPAAGAEAVVEGPSAPAQQRSHDARKFLLLGGAGTLGAGLAGIIGGLFYGFVGASQPLGPGILENLPGIVPARGGNLFLCKHICIAGDSSARAWRRAACKETEKKGVA